MGNGDTVTGNIATLPSRNLSKDVCSMIARADSIAIRTVLVCVVLCWSLFPIYLVVSSTFKFETDIFAVPPVLLDFSATFVNSSRLLSEWPQFFPSLLTSFLVTFGAALLCVSTSAMAGYVYSRYHI